jgi:hypothetical protein
VFARRPLAQIDDRDPEKKLVGRNPVDRGRPLAEVRGRVHVGPAVLVKRP